MFISSLSKGIGQHWNVGMKNNFFLCGDELREIFVRTEKIRFPSHEIINVNLVKDFDKPVTISTVPAFLHQFFCRHKTGNLRTKCHQFKGDVCVYVSNQCRSE